MATHLQEVALFVLPRDEDTSSPDISGASRTSERPDLIDESDLDVLINDSLDDPSRKDPDVSLGDDYSEEEKPTMQGPTAYEGELWGEAEEGAHERGRPRDRELSPPIRNRNEDEPSYPPSPPHPPPKSILRKPRERFPEEQVEIREGVAPLGVAGRSVPSDARWTRINRRLINPEALEQDGIRFDEFPDHLIVLKVLSTDEIEHYTQKTLEIRKNRQEVQAKEEHKLDDKPQGWIQDFIAAYRLSLFRVKQYLEGLFGRHEFSIRVSDPQFTV